MKLAAQRWPQVKALIEQGAIALWPTGSTEAHGPHLPLDTDVIISSETCERAAKVLEQTLGLSVLILPPLAFTVTDYASPFSGTISISKTTATAYVKEVIESASMQGFKAICLVNAHLEPAHRFALRDAVKTAEASCPVTIADPCDKRWVPTLTDEFKSGSCHAGQYESSLVMAATNSGADVEDDLRKTLPKVEIDLVGQMKAKKRTFVDMGANQAYFGDPSAASIEEGNWTYGKLTEMVVTMTKEALDEH